MKVLLTKPYNLSDHIQPSLGLGYLATSVRDQCDVSILDCIKEGFKVDKLRGYLIKNKPDILGLQCYTFDLKFINDALEAAKGVDKGILTVIGGPHPSAMPRETLEAFAGKLDFLFTGESEHGFAGLVRSLKKGEKDFHNVPGLAWREKGGIIINPPAREDDLDKLGMPAWDLIHPEKYPESQHGAFFKKFPIAPIMITRGCPYPCTFCAGNIVSGRKVRKRSIDHVLKEIVHLKKDFGIREFHVIDDNFTMDKNYAKEFLKRLKALDLDMSWAVPNGVRMDTLDEELLGLMKDTGLYLISLGIESGSDRVLRLMKKGTTVSKIRKHIQMIRNCGIDIAGFFILGFPGETASSIKRTISFARSLDLVRANFFTYLPFPGSESYKDLEAAGELDGVNWDRFYFMNAAYTPKGMDKKALKKFHRAAFSAFYLRPRIISYQIRSIQSFRHLLFLIKRFFHWIVMG